MSGQPSEAERAAAAYAAAQAQREASTQADTHARINGNEAAGTQ